RVGGWGRHGVSLSHASPLGKCAPRCSTRAMRLPLFALFAAGGCACLHGSAGRDWSVYLGDKAGSHYSTLTQITPANVGQLEVAWTFHAGDMREGATQIQCNPLIIDGVLYGTTPQTKVFALDAATGREL